MKMGSEEIRLRSFYWAAAGWFLIGCVGVAALTTPVLTALFWFAIFWALCVFGLFSLAKTVAVTLAFMFHQGAENKTVYGMQSAFWVSTKLMGFAAFGLVFYLGKNAPDPCLYFGLGTLVVVPVVGGLFWGRHEQQ